MVGKVNLSFDQRQNLASLQQINRQIGRASERLVTQRRINSPSDGITDYFVSERLGETVSLLKSRNEEITRGLSSLKVPNDGISGLRNFLLQAKGLLTQARASSQNEAQLSEHSRGFKEVFRQFILEANAVEFIGLNLITSTEQRLIVRYSNVVEERLEVQGRDIFASDVNATIGGLFSGNNVRASAFFNAANFSANLSNLTSPRGGVSFVGLSQLADDIGFATDIDGRLNEALQRLEIHEQFFATNLAILQNRQTFTTSFSNQLEISHTDLVSSDTREESVTLSALQTRNSLAISSLTLLRDTHNQLLRLLQ